MKKEKKKINSRIVCETKFVHGVSEKPWTSTTNIFNVPSDIAHKELGPGTRMAVKTWAKRLGRQTVSITMASGGES